MKYLTSIVMFELFPLALRHHKEKITALCGTNEAHFLTENSHREREGRREATMPMSKFQMVSKERTEQTLKETALDPPNVWWPFSQFSLQ